MAKKGQETKAYILKQAQTLFVQRGFKQVTMKDICLSCGLSRGGLYRHFDSTRTIFSHILKQFAEHQEQQMEEQMRQGIRAPLILHTFLEQYKREMLDPSTSLSLAIYEYSSLHPNNQMEDFYTRANKRWMAFLEYGIQRKEFYDVQKEEIITILLFAYQGIRMWGSIVPLPAAMPSHLIDHIRNELFHNRSLQLIRPTLDWKQEALAFRQELFDHKETIIHGGDLLDKIESYEEWLEHLRQNEQPETCDPDWVVSDTYFAVLDGKIIGIIDLRHSLNAFLKDIGHIGYHVRPSERYKGYAGVMLRQVLQLAKGLGLEEVSLSCFADNRASIKTIQSCHGKFTHTFLFEGRVSNAYTIQLNTREPV